MSLRQIDYLPMCARAALCLLFLMTAASGLLIAPMTVRSACTPTCRMTRPVTAVQSKPTNEHNDSGPLSNLRDSDQAGLSFLFALSCWHFFIGPAIHDTVVAARGF